MGWPCSSRSMAWLICFGLAGACAAMVIEQNKKANGTANFAILFAWVSFIIWLSLMVDQPELHILELDGILLVLQPDAPTRIFRVASVQCLGAVQNHHKM